MPDSSNHPFPDRNAGPWTVVCDFDGTIADVDVTDSLLKEFALPEWEAVEAEWKAGKIGSRECMARQVSMLRATRAELEAFLDTITIDAAFRDFINECRQRRLPLRIVSDGLDFSIRRILRNHALAMLPVISNRLVATGPNTWALEFPNSREGCRALSGTCKCGVAAEEPERRVLLIGDGSSDFCLAQSADFVFSKNRLTQHCRDQHIAHRDFSGFAELPYLLSELLDHPHHHRHLIPMSWETLTDGRIRTPA